MERTRHFGRTGLDVSRLGLGLAALGRPGYMTLGRRDDLPERRDVDAMRERTFAVLDAAWAAGVRYFDAARSYGRAELFLSDWIAERDLPPGELVVGSKWGYEYTADWRVDAEVHEVKELSADRLRRQWSVSRKLLWEYLDLYQIHSATLDSGVLDDAAVLNALAELKAAYGVRVGLSLSGPGQADTLDKAAGVELDGERLFDAVQATWNPLEPSVQGALLAAREAGFGVIVKEAVANGRLTDRGLPTLPSSVQDDLREAAARHGVDVAVWATAAAMARPWADVVLSGAVTAEQVEGHAAALELAWTDADEAVVGAVAQPAETYWADRKRLEWT